jgi:excisionase family DNA binding protein
VKQPTKIELEATIAQRLAKYDRALTTEEIADVWNVRAWTVRQWLRAGKLVGYRISNEWRVDAADALEFWERRRAGK